MKTRLEVSISWCNSVISGPLVPLKWSRQVSHSLRPTHRVWVLSVTRGLLLGWGCLVFVSYHPGADTHTHTHTQAGVPLLSSPSCFTQTHSHTHIYSLMYTHTQADRALTYTLTLTHSHTTVQSSLFSSLSDTDTHRQASISSLF